VADFWTWQGWDALASIGTLFLAVVALLIAFFQEPVRRWWSRARLGIEIRKAPPDTHQIDVTSLGGVFAYKAIYVRARVSHEGGGVAENVEMMVTGLWEVSGSSRTPRTEFLPLPLSSGATSNRRRRACEFPQASSATAMLGISDLRGTPPSSSFSQPPCNRTPSARACRRTSSYPASTSSSCC